MPSGAAGWLQRKECPLAAPGLSGDPIVALRQQVGANRTTRRQSLSGGGFGEA